MKDQQPTYKFTERELLDILERQVATQEKRIVLLKEEITTVVQLLSALTKSLQPMVDNYYKEMTQKTNDDTMFR